MIRISLLLFLLIAISKPSIGQSKNVASELSDAIINRYQPTINAMTAKGWDHSNSVILHAMEKIYLQNKNPKYLKYIKDFVDSYVDDKGLITDLKTELDGIHPGILCLFLYEETGELKYKAAATQLKEYLFDTSLFNKTPEGGYWHKNNDHYNDVMTIDGVYMANPFLLKYGILFNDKTCIEFAVDQTLLIAS